MAEVMEKPRAPKNAKAPKSEFQCDFCHKDFVAERSLINHACERKRRWMDRNEKNNRIGFMAYQKFYEISLRSKKPKTYEDFMESKYFSAFINFGRHVSHLNAIEPMGFTEYLIRGNVPLNGWVQEVQYESWVRELSRKESPMKAVERNILLMEQWGREQGEDWINFFRLVSTIKATDWIRKGRISPWLLYCDVGRTLIDRMSDEQLGMIKEWINPLYWQGKIRDNKAEVDHIEAILREAGV